MKYSEQRELVDSLRELADFYEQRIELPRPDVQISTHITRYDKEWKRDPFEERLAMRRIAKSIGNAEKDYSYYFTLKKKFGRITVRWSVPRDSVCEKKVVGTKYHPEQVIAAHTEEIVEWECRDSLLA